MLAEPDSTDTLTLKSIVRDDDLTDDDWRNLEPGPIFPPIMTDQMLEKLEEKGINPDEIIYACQRVSPASKAGTHILAGDPEYVRATDRFLL